MISKFDLTLNVVEEDSGLSCRFEYNTDLFDGLTIERLSVHFEQLLRGLVADPSSRISEVEMLTQAERDQQLVEWNDTAVDYPRDKCVHELFEGTGINLSGCGGVGVCGIGINVWRVKCTFESVGALFTGPWSCCRRVGRDMHGPVTGDGDRYIGCIEEW